MFVGRLQKTTKDFLRRLQVPQFFKLYYRSLDKTLISSKKKLKMKREVKIKNGWFIGKELALMKQNMIRFVCSYLTHERN